MGEVEVWVAKVNLLVERLVKDAEMDLELVVGGMLEVVSMLIELAGMLKMDVVGVSVLEDIVLASCVMGETLV